MDCREFGRIGTRDGYWSGRICFWRESSVSRMSFETAEESFTAVTFHGVDVFNFGFKGSIGGRSVGHFHPTFTRDLISVNFVLSHETLYIYPGFIS